MSMQSLPDTPLTRCTALAFDGALLAVGEDSIYHYQPSSRSWVEAGELPTIWPYLYSSPQWGLVCGCW